MLGKRFYQLLNLTFYAITKFGAFRYTWSQSRNLFVKQVDNQSCYKKYATNNIIYLVWLTFCLCQAMSFYFLHQYNEVSFLLLFATLICCAIIFTAITNFHGDNWFTLVNSLLIFLRWINGRLKH